MRRLQLTVADLIATAIGGTIGLVLVLGLAEHALRRAGGRTR